MLPLLGLCALPLAAAKSAVQQPPGMMMGPRGGDDNMPIEIDLMGPDDGPVMMGGPPGILGGPMMGGPRGSMMMGGPMMGGPRSSHPREQALDAMMMEMLSGAMGGPGGRGGPPGMVMLGGPGAKGAGGGAPPGFVQMFGDDDDGPGGSQVIPMGDGEVVFEIDDDGPPGQGPQKGRGGGMDQDALLALMGGRLDGSPGGGPFGGPPSRTESNHRRQDRMDDMRMQTLMDNSYNDIQAVLAPHKDGFPHSCVPEVTRRCAGGRESWEAMRKYACLLPYLDQVSTQCNRDLAQSVPNVCKDEITKYCNLLDTSILDCLGGQITKLQGACKEAASDALHISNTNKTLARARSATAAPGKDKVADIELRAQKTLEGIDSDIQHIQSKRQDLGSVIDKEMLDLESAISGAKLHKLDPAVPATPQAERSLLPPAEEEVFSKDMSILANALTGAHFHKNEPPKPALQKGLIENPELDQRTQNEMDGDFDALERALTGHKKMPQVAPPLVKKMVSKEREPTQEEKKVEEEIDKETALLMKALEGAHMQKQGVRTNSAIHTENRSLKAVDTTLFRGAKTILVLAAILALVAVAAMGFSAAAPVTAEKHMEKIRRLMTVRDSESEYLLEGGELQFKAPPML